ncbi:pseudouridine synthase [Candidatus Woesearchaeota archaeon]|nr:pseudouridine synthase [Candidatus Woesearchaeota archaeon]
MAKKISLKQFLMKTGFFEDVEQCILAIRNGEIRLNKETVFNPHHFFNPKKYSVFYRNERIRPVKMSYFMMNKPKGFICQKSANENTIYNLLESGSITAQLRSSLFAVGRLDKDTSGLLIITNDGQLSDRLAKPERHVSKKYLVELKNSLKPEDTGKLEEGIKIDVKGSAYKTKPCKARLIEDKKAEITIFEGKKRQIRKMFEAIRNEVVALERTAVGGLELEDLKPGELKEFQREEIYKILFDGPKE